MSESFKMESEHKSWADIIEEEEEEKRLHSDHQDGDGHVAQHSDQQTTTITAADESKEAAQDETKESKEQEKHILSVQLEIESIDTNSADTDEKAASKLEEAPLKEESSNEETVKEETVNVEAVKEAQFDGEEPTKIEPTEEKPAEIDEKSADVEAVKPVLTGAKASRWASAPNEPPKASKWATRSEDKSSATGSMQSKWAHAPSNTSHGYNNNNRSRYDNTNRYGNNDRYGTNDRHGNNDRYGNSDRYGNRYNSRYDNTDKPTGGRLNRSIFEDDTKKQGDNFERKNHYDRDSDRDNRNGGFDNKDNFVNRRREKTEAETQAINSWNSYKPPADEDEPKTKQPEEQKPVEQKPAEEKPVEQKKEEKLPLDDIANFKPASFSWADDIDNSSDDDFDPSFDKLSPKIESNDDHLSNVDISTPEPVLKEDETNAPESDFKDTEDIPTPELITKDECFKANESVEEKPLPPVYNWGSLEKLEVVKESEPVEQPSLESVDIESKPLPTYNWGALEEPEAAKEAEHVEQPSEVTVQENVDIESKPLPTYTWGSLEEYKPEVDQPVAKPAIDKESALLGWNALRETVEIEEKPLPETPPTEVEVVATATTTESDWNKDVSWNTGSTTEQAVEPQQESWSTNTDWNNDTTSQQQSTWNTSDQVDTASVESKPVIKDSWKNKLKAVEQDNASAWKSFADTVAIPPPPVVKVEEKKVDISAPQSWNTVQQSTDWNSIQQKEPEPAIQKEPEPSVQKEVSKEAPATSSWGSFAEEESKPKEVPLKLSDFTATAPSNAPLTASFKLSDFSSAPKKSPEVVSLKLSDFASPAPTASFKLSDFTSPAPTASFKLSDFATDPVSESKPHTVSLRLGDLNNAPTDTKNTATLSLRLSDFDTPTHSFKLSDFDQPAQSEVAQQVAQPPATTQQQQQQAAYDDWKTNTSWVNDNQPYKAHVKPPTPTIAERHPEKWGEVSKQHTFVNSPIVESERPRRKLQKAGGQWNILQKNLMGTK